MCRMKCGRFDRLLEIPTAQYMVEDEAKLPLVRLIHRLVCRRRERARHHARPRTGRASFAADDLQ